MLFILLLLLLYIDVINMLYIVIVILLYVVILLLYIVTFILLLLWYIDIIKLIKSLLQIQSAGPRHPVLPTIHNDARITRETRRRVVENLPRLDDEGTGGSWLGHHHRVPLERLRRVDRWLARHVHYSRCLKHTDHVTGAQCCQQVLLGRAGTIGEHFVRGQDAVGLQAGGGRAAIQGENDGRVAGVIRSRGWLKKPGRIGSSRIESIQNTGY